MGIGADNRDTNSWQPQR